MCKGLEEWGKKQMEMGIAKMVLTLLRKGKTVEETADLLDLTEEYVRKVQEESQEDKE